jgi:hypothetical protein
MFTFLLPKILLRRCSSEKSGQISSLSISVSVDGMLTAKRFAQQEQYALIDFRNLFDYPPGDDEIDVREKI